MIGIIYRYISPSEKSYVGQTIQGNTRKVQHKYNAHDKSYAGYYLPFYCAIRKYGWDSFQYEVLKTIDLDTSEQDLNYWEIYYIGFYDSFNNGYNLTIGGNGLNSITHPSCKKVIQYSLEGNFINSYFSVAEAARNLGIDSSRIAKCCRLQVKSCGGFQWRYSTSEEIYTTIEKIENRKKNSIVYVGEDNKNSKKVYQYDLNYTFIKEWISASEAYREKGFDSGGISKVCNNIKPSYGKKGEEKFIWSYIKLIKDNIDQ